MKPEFKYLQKIGLTDKSILEIGCGDGEVTEFLSKSCDKIQAVDTNKELISIARKKVIKAQLFVGSGENLPFKNNLFDLVIFSKSLHHHKNPGLALEGATRVAKLGGEIIIIELVPNTEYQEVLEPVHDEERALKETAEAIRNSKITTLNRDEINSPKKFKDFDNFMQIINERFTPNKRTKLRQDIESILGKKIEASPLILRAKLDIYRLKPIQHKLTVKKC